MILKFYIASIILSWVCFMIYLIQLCMDFDITKIPHKQGGGLVSLIQLAILLAIPIYNIFMGYVCIFKYGMVKANLIKRGWSLK